jgi:predicted site-specific integrase-resolvase
MAPDYRPPDGFLTLAQARERLGISRMKAWAWAKEGVLPVYEDPRDKRVKLVRVEDVERLAQPRLRRGPSQED